MIILYSIIAFFIAWIWIDYYRNIDIFDKEKLIFVITSFILGGLSVFIVTGFHNIIYSNYNLEINGNFLNDLFYTSIIVGATEELAKLIPFLIMLHFIKNEITEPIDYIIYITASALGFSAIENIKYFDFYGSHIVFARAILSSVSHMFCSAIVAYGIMRYKYHPKHKNKFYQILIFFFLAALSHGIYNFLLMHKAIGPYRGILNFIYFLLTISIFAVIINNCLNNSPFFTYKRVIDNRLISNKLIFYYGVVLFAQFIFIFIKDDFFMALLSVFYTLITAGFVAFVSIVRLSRFKLIKGRWENIKLELPFSFQARDAMLIGVNNNSHQRWRLRVKGHAYNEIHLNKYYQEYFQLKPLNTRRSYLKKTRKSFIIEKFFLGDYIIFYLVNIYYGNNNEKVKQILISPKTSGKMHSTKDEAIVSVFVYDDDFIDINKINPKKVKFQEWALAINSKETQAINELKMLES